jgi:hypothetical protein
MTAVAPSRTSHQRVVGESRVPGGLVGQLAGSTSDEAAQAMAGAIAQTRQAVLERLGR